VLLTKRRGSTELDGGVGSSVGALEEAAHLMRMWKSQSFEREKTLMCVFRCLQAAQVSKSSSEAFSHVYERQFWHSPTGIFNNKNNNKILINNSKNKNIYNNPIL
jgi:hypothetical protein